jgi:hypothetical protein
MAEGEQKTCPIMMGYLLRVALEVQVQQYPKT